MRFRYLIVLSLCAAVFLTACQPQGGTAVPSVSVAAIAYEQTAQGTLGTGENHHIFLGKQNDTISIQITFTGVPVPVALVDPNGDSIARIPATVGRLDRFRLPADGKYTIIVGAGSGAYALALRSMAMVDADATQPATVPAVQSKSIGIGDSRLGTLQPPVEQDLWSLNGEAGTVISVQMTSTSPQFDPALQIYGPDGAQIAGDDNSGGGTDALVSGLKLPTSGIYLIQASGKGQSGSYTLTVQSGSVPTPTQPPPPTAGPSPTAAPSPIPVADVGSQIRIGETVEGAINDRNQVDRYAVFGPAGTVISIAMFRTADSTLMPAFEVFAPNGDQITQAKGAAGAIISGFTLPVTGAYIIFPHADQYESSGGYSLSVGDGWTLRDFHPGAVNPEASEANHGTLSRTGDRDVWLVDMLAQVTFSVEVTPEQPGFQPVLEVIGPDGKQLGATLTDSKTHTATLNALVTPTEGRYQIRIGALPGAAAGSYTMTTHILRIDPTATFGVALDEIKQDEVQQNGRYTYTFKGNTGVVVLIEAHGKGDFDPVIVLYGPSGRRLALSDDSTAEGTDAAIQIALDDGAGAYTVQVYGYAMTPGAFTLHVKTD